MSIDATFWVAISFFVFIGSLIYLKIPSKVNSTISEKIDGIKKEIEEAEKLKDEAKNLLNEYENKIEKSKKEVSEIINKAKKESEKAVLERTKKFHLIIEGKKRSTEQKITQMKDNAIKDIKNLSAKISIKTVESLIKNSIDKSKIENLYKNNLNEAKIALKLTKS
tara:strand:+ start:534 stop:1031 length:498 start_codon:yes stop_codon:yes gene_type:complete